MSQTRLRHPAQLNHVILLFAPLINLFRRRAAQGSVLGHRHRPRKRQGLEGAGAGLHWRIARTGRGLHGLVGDCKR